MNQTATGGTRGAEVRSDCWVCVEPSAGAPSLVINSKVAALYGNSIRTTVAATLAALGASDLSVTLDDRGALPFTLMARVELAVKRLRPDTHLECLPEINPAALGPATRHRLRRTRLYLPGNTPKFFVNAGLYHPDGIILDLEDSVPEDQKDAALYLVRNALRVVDFYGAEKMVRINRLPRGLDDARTLIPHGVHTFLVPKVEEADQVRALDRLVADSGKEIWMIPILESARGVWRALEIASASPRIAGLAIGLEDYARDIGAEPTLEGRESLWASSQVVAAARAAGITPLGSVFGHVADESGLRAFVHNVRELGFEGIGCLHPRQVRIAHEAFAPAPEEIERACRTALAFQGAQDRSQGTAALDGRMIDVPVVARAWMTIRMARTLDRLAPEWESRLRDLV